MKISALISEKQSKLTAGQKRVLKYILENNDEAVFMTATKLSKKAGVGEATVVRLAQVLGFQGYSDMQRHLREEFQDRLSTVTRLEKSIKDVRNDGDLLKKIIQQDIQNLTRTLNEISPETFQKAVKDITESRTIYVAGLRGSHAPAIILGLYLNFLKKDARLLVPGYGDVWNVLFGLGPEDLVIGISFPRYTRLTVEILEYAHNHGAKVGAITDSLISPLAEYADWVLPVYSRMDSFVESFTASISIANALLTAVSIRNLDETLEILQEKESIWKDKKIYVPSTTTDIQQKKRNLERMIPSISNSN
ncbi:MAG: MurR/RpiR family transcriptional regulator [Proteobacteria bacterium]|nr:MurR/RpiR family transcriptional regulator [Pseudomonadota bacterium]